MRGAKDLDGKRVRILADCTTKCGSKFKAGEEGTFTKSGVVRCIFETDDGRRVNVGMWSVSDFEIAS